MESEEAVAEALLASLDVAAYEPEVVGVILEQMHRSARTLLSDARDLAAHRGSDQIEPRDVRKVRRLVEIKDRSRRRGGVRGLDVASWARRCSAPRRSTP